MNVPVIEMTREEAARRLEEYRKALRRSSDEEYAAAVKGYEALASGTPVIQYGDAIRAGGFDEKMRPRIAIARADIRGQVVFRWTAGTHAEFSTLAESMQWNGAGVRYLGRWPNGLRAQIVDFRRPHGRTKTWNGHVHTDNVVGFALVPMIPPAARRAAGGSSALSRHLVLWEVEEWADRPIHAVPDRDPYLLRPIHGDLCAVVAQWDLTDLERAVMGGRVGT